MKRCGIYTITNTISNKIYVGSTTRLFCQRWGDHKVQLRAGNHTNLELQNAWNKHGEKTFEFEVLDSVEFPEHVIGAEQFWMNMLDTYKNGFNRNPVAANSYGLKRSKETCIKLGKTGNWRKANAAWVGSNHTEETKKIIREKRARQVMVPRSAAGNKKASEALKISLLGNRNRMKYFDIVADNGVEILNFKDIREAKKYFGLKSATPISRVFRGERKHFKGYKFTCAMT